MYKIGYIKVDILHTVSKISRDILFSDFRLTVCYERQSLSC